MNDYRKLDMVLREHGMLCAVAAAPDGSILARRGDFSNAEASQLLSGLIGPYGDAKTTFDSLEGQILPRMSGQGEVYAFVYKPMDDLMVITIGFGRLPATAEYEKSKEVDASIVSVVAKEKKKSAVIPILATVTLIMMMMDVSVLNHASTLEMTGFEALANVMRNAPLFVLCYLVIICLLRRLNVWIRIIAIAAVLPSVLSVSSMIFHERIDYIELDQKWFPSHEVMGSLDEKYQNRLQWVSSSASNCKVHFPKQIFNKNELIEDIKNKGLGIK